MMFIRENIFGFSYIRNIIFKDNNYIAQKYHYFIYIYFIFIYIYIILSFDIYLNNMSSEYRKNIIVSIYIYILHKHFIENYLPYFF